MLVCGISVTTVNSEMEPSCRLTIGSEEFHKLAENFLEKSLKLGDNWELRTTHSRSTHTPHHYLVKKHTQTLKTVSCKMVGVKERVGTVTGKDLEDLAGDISGLSEDTDLASLDNLVSEREEVQERLVHVEYHVVHSMTYQVPVFYFNATHSNGEALPLSDIWSLLSPDFVSHEADKWSLVTQQEHPYLGRPFYHIHPCHTATVMGRAMQCCTVGVRRHGGEEKEASGGNYLITWLSTFAPVIGLEFSLKYAQ